MEKESTLTREQRLEVEERAIQALIDMGVRFSVPLKFEPRKTPKRVVLWNRLFPKKPIVWRDKRFPKDWEVTVEDVPDPAESKIKKTYMRHFHIKPLYLGTIDALRRLYINIEYDEDVVDEDPITEGKKLFKYTSLMAEIAATAVLNSPEVSRSHSKEVKELADFFLTHLTVKKLKRLALLIDQMMDSGGFTSSIRLIKKIGTTQPKLGADLVE